MAEHNIVEQTKTEPEKISKENQVTGQKRPNEGAPIPGTT